MIALSLFVMVWSEAVWVARRRSDDAEWTFIFDKWGVVFANAKARLERW